MSTSLGSNTYNRQNWEDAVSPEDGGGEAGRALAGGALRCREGRSGGGGGGARP